MNPIRYKVLEQVFDADGEVYESIIEANDIEEAIEKYQEINGGCFVVIKLDNEKWMS